LRARDPRERIPGLAQYKQRDAVAPATALRNPDLALSYKRTEGPVNRPFG